MHGVSEVLDSLTAMASADPELRKSLLDTAASPYPLTALCEIARRKGFELYEMDVIDAGEAMYASIKRSTNGGGENSPVLTGQNDCYEMFIAGLREKK